MTAIQATNDFIRAHKEQALQSVIDFCSIPSISTLSDHKHDMERAAAWVADRLRAIGLDAVQVMPTGGHPVVYGENLRAHGQLTVLIYGHYDVQPADPVDEWESPAFEPTGRGDNLYARGASDNKGQIVAVLAALQAWSRAGDGLPVNIKMIIEGEEEVGSPNLAAFIEEHGELLAADFCMNVDSGIGLADNPSIVYGLRGLAYFELWVHGPQSDLHSGMFGGAVHNPANVLCELIAGMHAADGRITLPMCYENVHPLSEDERASFARLPHDEESVRTSAANPPALFGEDGFSTIERIGGRPALDVNGLYSGFIGEGSKTVLPAKAMAKLSMRLVPDQDPSEIARSLRAYLLARAPKTVRWELKELAHAKPVVVNRDFLGVRAAEAALESVFGVPPTYMRMGGTVPAVSMFSDVLGMDTVNLGFALDDDGIHGPNEKLHLPTFYRGVVTYAHFFENLAR
ncbi:MAG: dipeptidase [Anaerolineales bacterium]|jgi:acetylornithine deacetylase/succinyl-diaminopimelate desuccinylase-like protein|nr:dipeptidase [Anaerolineales bacterium]HJO33451.1 dipeptidase [Anaerolineales bacterium]